MDHKEIYGKIQALKKNLEKVIHGKPDTIDLAMTTLFAGGHLLIEDVPGIGKTTLAHGLAKSINCTFQRIQFTSDLLPSDVIGVTIYNQSDHCFEFKPGPIFANIVLADEINRTSPKTQSALLEAMNDGQVSVEKVTHPLPRPFMLLATQNPLEYAGTFPLPESQLDRFAMRISIGYPAEDVERDIIESPPEALMPENLTPVITSEDVMRIQEATEKVKVEEDLVSYMLGIAGGTRNVKTIRLGVSPRGTMTLYRATQAMALVNGRDYCTPDDIKTLVVPVFAHRIIPAQSIGGGGGGEEGIEDAEALIEEILSTATVPV
jgi:MoxR-like ATPase